MIKNLARGFAALSLSLTPLLAPTPALARAVPTETTTLAAAENRAGYTRTAFKHWNAGAVADDGCNTRAEVLIAEVHGQGPARPSGRAGCRPWRAGPRRQDDQ
ncbi:hypothetical protein [Streptomyces sp. PA5.6]|uniref:hypothetical protein n=1 Tax=Streptomyces sp. PA5.6 TaxID=3035651 RepID=UPI003904781A